MRRWLLVISLLVGVAARGAVRITATPSSGLEGNEGVKNVPVTITQNPPQNFDVAYKYRTVDETATAADNDFFPLDDTLVIPAGQTQGTIVVRIVGDTKVEGDETFRLEVDNVQNSPFIFTILNDDAPAVHVDNASVPEGNSGTTAMTFNVVLDTPAQTNVTVNYTTGDQTAIAGEDYVPALGTLTFLPGEVLKSVVVNVNGDTAFEPDETFLFSANPSVGAIPGAVAFATGTIVNDDQRAATRITIVSGGGQSGRVGQPLAQPLTIQVLNEVGGPVSGVTVQWRATQGAATIDPAVTTTNADGRASTTVTPQSVGTIVIEASVANLAPVTFTITSSTSLEERAQGPVAKPIAHVLDAVCARNEETFTRVCSALARLDGGALTSTLERVAPQHSGAQAKVAAEVVATVTSGIAARLSAIRNGAERFSIQRLSLNSGGHPIPVATIASLLFASDESPEPADADYNGWSAFLSGNLGDGERVTHPGELGFDLKSRGLMFGVDRQVGDGVVVGVSVNWQSLDSDLDRGAGSVDTKGYALSLYGSRAGLFANSTDPRAHYDGVHLDGSLTYGRNKYDSEHIVEILGEPLALARSTNDANVFAVGGAAGIDAHRGRTEVDASLSGTWSRADVEDLTEDGPGPLILFVEGHEVESLTGSASLNLRSTFSAPFGTITPSVRGEFVHEFESGARLVTAHFLKDRFGTSFTIPIDQPDENYGRAGAALQAGFPRGWTAFIEVMQDVARSDLHFRTLQFNIQKSF